MMYDNIYKKFYLKYYASFITILLKGKGNDETRQKNNQRYSCDSHGSGALLRPDFNKSNNF